MDKPTYKELVEGGMDPEEARRYLLGAPLEVKAKPRRSISGGLIKRLMARAQGKCENCGKNLYNHEKIDIHHKNYEPTDNRESNLMVVCFPCHKKLTGPRPRD